MIPILILGMCIGFVVVSLKDGGSTKVINSATRVKGSVESPVNVTSHLAEFTRLIRQGHRPNQWLVTQAVNEAFRNGDWVLAKTISDSFTNPVPIRKRKSSPVEAKESEVEKPGQIEEASPENPKLLGFSVEKTTSPIEGVSNDDWRMFVHASSLESPDFESENSKGMFRQNKKRILKLGASVDTPVSQYSAFESEVLHLLDEGRELIKQSVAMPIEVDGESLPMTLSGLLAVMRVAGTANATKWVDSPEERKRFPNTSKVFKLTNGCF